MLDKIDKWMKRTLGESKTPSSPTANVGTSPKHDSQKPAKKSFHKKKHNHKKPNNNQNQNFKHSGGGNRGGFNKRPYEVKKDRPTGPTPILNGQIKIIPLGGLNEVGKNMTVMEYEEDIIVIDAGFQFPGEELPGIDYIVPDINYLERNKKRIRGIFITHGHLDHIGGIPYILPKLDYPPIYATKLTAGLIDDRLKEFKQEKLAKVHFINPDEPIRAGKMLCRFIRVMHSIPDCVAIVVDTPVGSVMHTGDFKFDDNPARNMIRDDIGKMEKLASQNLLALLCESTNSIKPGHTISEKEVGDALDEVVGEAPKRIIISSFSSQIGRLQQVLDAAVRHGRKIYISGRSMRNNIETAYKLGYINVPKEQIFDVKRYKENEQPDEKTLILTTGSQGEPLAALARIASGDHPQIKAKKGDTIVFSSSPIIGNEHSINKLVNAFCKLGCHIVSNHMKDIHTSGHGKQDELIRMINYARPKYLIPIHGEYYMRQALGELATKNCGIPEENIFLLENGGIVIGGRGKMQRDKEPLDIQDMLIDGSGEGTIDSHVIFDRQMMAKNGALIILIPANKNRRPDIVSRGLMYMHESQEITEEIAKLAKEAYETIRKKNPGADRRDIKKYVKYSVERFVNKRLQREPLIIPLIVD
ncbi:ribonuclease J [Candidatus Peregrinibacteria bacterium CG10_big_fil_rev_8_21_14_0_10_36_19]|nr:MAG: ribonuclease J [Candidatus Peregrinibacteria bacterium CG10_big_fil_rev_8_21_14_0_10_36_19]